MLLLFVASIGATDASAKGKRIRACVVKKGPDKGVMHFSRKGKCHKGEKKISWKKRGKRGKRGKPGTAGQTGATGPKGPAGAGVTDELLLTIESQKTTIEQLQTDLGTAQQQIAALTSQLGGLAPQVEALCDEVPVVVGQANSLLAAVAPIPLVGVLPPALSAFSCP